MSYTKTTDFAAKDALLAGDPNKLIRGSELGSEFDAIQTADALNMKSATLAASGGAALVGYIQTGTGAEATTVQAKLREMVSVTDFGADGSNTDNNDTPFTNAVAAGGIVYVPPPSSKYKFNATTFPKGAAILLDPSSDWDDLTDGGKLNILRGPRPDYPEGQNIWRFTDRVFIGDAAAFLSGLPSPNQGTSWFGDTTNYAGYLGINGKLVLSTSDSYDDLPYGIVAGVRTSDTQQEGIGVGVHVVCDSNTSTHKGWGFIAELQREVAAPSMYGLEIAAKNKSSDATLTPNSQVAGVYGVWAAAGGDNAFGGASTNPSTAALVVLKNSNTWNTGIVMMKDALTSGKAISLSSEGVGGAHRVSWYNALGDEVFYVSSSATATTGWSIQQRNYGITFWQGSAELLRLTTNTAPVNFLNLFSNNTGSAPTIEAVGSDTNIDLTLTSKGSGLIRFGTWTSNADAAINGFVLIKDAAGNQRKLATIA